MSIALFVPFFILILGVIAGLTPLLVVSWVIAVIYFLVHLEHRHLFGYTFVLALLIDSLTLQRLGSNVILLLLLALGLHLSRFFLNKKASWQIVVISFIFLLIQQLLLERSVNFGVTAFLSLISFFFLYLLQLITQSSQIQIKNSGLR